MNREAEEADSRAEGTVDDAVADERSEPAEAVPEFAAGAGRLAETAEPESPEERESAGEETPKRVAAAGDGDAETSDAAQGSPSEMFEASEGPVPTGSDSAQLEDWRGTEEPAVPVEEEEEAEGPSAGASEALDRLHREIVAVAEGIREDFAARLSYDESKERMFSRLHEELQSYKADLLASVILPLVRAVIRLHDDLGKVAEAFAESGDEPVSPRKVEQVLSGFQDDIEILLADHDVVLYRAEGDRIDPRRQQVLKTVRTTDPGQVGAIAERVRPGFERDGRPVRKEKVAVFKLTRESAPPAPAESEAAGEAYEGGEE